MRLANFGLHVVLSERSCDPILQIGAIGLVCDMLQLAAPTLREVAARRLLMVGAGLDGTVFVQQVAGRGERGIASAGRDSVAASGNSDDRFAHR